MASLADFNTAPKPVLDDLSTFAGGGTLDVGTPVNQDTISNIAAHAAVLAPPEDVTPTFSSVTNELKAGGSSPTLDAQQAQRKMLDDAANVDTISRAMADPTISQDEKVKLLSGYTSSQNNPLNRSMSAQVTTQAAMAPSSPNDNDETNYTRVDVTKNMDEVDAYNGWVTQQSNNLRNLTFHGGLTDTLDVVEGLVPFMTQGAQAKIAGALSDNTNSQVGAVAKSLTILGESRQEMADAVSKMPIADRMQFAQKLLDNIKNSGGSITSRPNDLNMINELQQSLTAGGYGGTQRVIDNIVSVLDLTLVGGPMWKGAVKFAKGLGVVEGAVKGGANEARAEAALARLNKTTTEAISSAQATPVAEDVTKAVSEAPKAAEGPLPISSEVGNQASFEDAYSKAGNVVDKPIDPNTVNATRDIILENVHQELNKLGAPPGVIADTKTAIGKKITQTSITDPNLPKTVTNMMRQVFRKNSLEGIDPTVLKDIREFVDARSSVLRRTVKTDVDFGSVSQAVKDVNPEKSRLMLDAATADETGAVAKALYGTNRTEAVADAVLPEVGEAGGTVRGKPSIDPPSKPSPDQAFIDQQKAQRGDIYLSDKEKAAARNTVVNDFSNVVGLASRKEMSSIEQTSNGSVKVSQVLGPKDGGFASAQQALTQAKFGLRKYGVSEADIEILGRNEQGVYAPIDKATTEPGDYLARVNYEHQFSPTDAVGRTMSSKFWRLFDAVPPSFSGKQGAISNHLIPAVNINDTLLTNAASVAADRTASFFKGLETLGKNYADKLVKLDNYQKTLVHSYIIKANNERLKFDPLALKAIGMSDDGIDTVRAWKTAQDTNFHYENLDLNKTLRAKGWQKFVDQTGDTSLVARPIGKGSLSSSDLVIGEDGKAMKMNAKALDELYDAGGTIAVLRRPIEIDGDSVEHILVKNNAESSYLRNINDSDQTLSYIDGHYTVRYHDPYFITKTMKGAGGKEYQKALATAGTRKEAQELYDRLSTTDIKGEYDIKGDSKKDPNTYADYQWDTIVSSGRTSQRVRGSRLADATGIPTDLNHVHIESPEESLINSFKNLATRVSYNDYLNAAKTRWMSQFGHMLRDADKGVFPADVRVIGAQSKLFKAFDLADARTTWRYIDSVDNGFVNILDDASKSFFNFMSDTTGNSKSWAWLERPMRAASEMAPVARVRKVAARLMLSANPIGQLTLQASQALPVVLGTNMMNPLMLGRIGAQVLILNGMKYGLKVEDMALYFKKGSQLVTGMTLDQAKAMVEHYRTSNFEAAVDANVLIKDNLTKLADRGFTSVTKRAIRTPLDIMQKVGFEAGENLLMQSAWLSGYNRLLHSGEKIDAAALEKLNAQTRAWTSNMNNAGKMPYNENVLSPVFQFMQSTHKAMATMIAGHKGISGTDRAGIVAAYITTFGLGNAAASAVFDHVLPANMPGRQYLADGFFDTLFNKTLETLFHTTSETDFSDRFRVLQFPDMFQFFHGLMSMQLSQTLSASPSASLVFGNNPRITNFVKEFMRPFTVPGEMNADQLKTVGVSFLNNFPMMSNFFKAQYILSHGRAIGTTGKTTDPDSSYLDGLMKLGGFRTHNEVLLQQFQQKSYDMSSKVTQDIKYLVTETARHLAVKGITPEESKWYMDQMAEAQRVYKGQPFYMNLFQKEIVKQVLNGNDTLFISAMKLSGFYKKGDIQDLINNSPMSDEDKQSVMKQFKTIEEE